MNYYYRTYKKFVGFDVLPDYSFVDVVEIFKSNDPEFVKKINNSFDFDFKFKKTINQDIIRFLRHHKSNKVYIDEHFFSTLFGCFKEHEKTYL